MKPLVFFQLSHSAQVKMLYSQGVFVRQKEQDPFIISLFLLGNVYYELLQHKASGRLHFINYLDENAAGILFPGVSEWEFATIRKK